MTEAPTTELKAVGVMRSEEHPRELTVVFNRQLTDKELIRIHDAMIQAVAMSAYPPGEYYIKWRVK